jgi:hypothetical protein
MFDQPIAQEVINAMSRLNSFVRSESFGYHYSSQMRYIIYGHKDHLINAAISAGMASQRLIAVKSKCRTCHGTGMYDHWRYNGGDEGCWTCRGTGKVMLYFSETTLPGGIVFHTPIHSVPTGELVTIESGWKPNQRGKDLTPAELAEALNIIEAWRYVGDEFPRQFEMSGYTDSYAPFYYRLHVGRVEGCLWCGVPAPRIAHQYTKLLEWEYGICDACRVRYAFTTHLWQQEPPGILIAHAPIREWLRRRAEWTEKENRFVKHIEPIPF